MSKKPLGFISKGGMVAAALVLAIVGVWTGVFGPSLFSPGGLSTYTSGRALGGMKSHAETKGTCDACHAEPWSSQDMAFRCVRCHVTVGEEMRTRKGLHGLLAVKSTVPGCRECHVEHRGPNGQLTLIDQAKFPHELTGFSLNGHKHTVQGAAFTCKDCHGTDMLHYDQSTCAKCHKSIDSKFMTAHEATFGKTCLICHDGSGRDGTNFDHNKFRFKLTGAHANAPCIACHSRAGSSQALAATSTECYSCHAGNDIHKGSLGKQCGQCHTATTWGSATFSHSSLTGDLSTKDCASCHANDDRHGGSLGRLCGQCHNTRSWGGATFSHAGFPTSHGGASACVTCHPKGTGTYTCFGCHAHAPASIQSQHGGSSLTSIRNCVQCHQGGGGFSHRGFPSSHGGASSCATCHPNGNSTYTCFGCHEHSASNIAGEHDGRSLSEIKNCASCHRGGGGEGGGGEGGRRGEGGGRGD
jgi:hypothetical protein